MVNIVTIDGQRYMVDVGFGPSGPTHPLPLLDSSDVHQSLPGQSVRLAHTSPPQYHDSSQRVWVCECRSHDVGTWAPSYCFSELEFGPDDFEVMNYMTSTSRTSWFTYSIMCSRMLMEEGKLVGSTTLLGRVLKQRVDRKERELKTCDSEDERLQVLEEHFGIILSETERRGILGMVTAIK